MKVDTKDYQASLVLQACLDPREKEECQGRLVPKVLKVSQDWPAVEGLLDHLVLQEPKETSAHQVSLVLQVKVAQEFLALLDLQEKKVQEDLLGKQVNPVFLVLQVHLDPLPCPPTWLESSLRWAMGWMV